MSKKSQAGAEFMVIFGAVIFFFTLFFLAIQERTADVNRDKEIKLIKNLALSIQDEINLASKETNGYSREFSVPEKINSKNYEISIIDGRIYIKTERNAVSYPVGKVQGSIQKGVNKIKKENDLVYLNPI